MTKDLDHPDTPVLHLEGEITGGDVEELELLIIRKTDAKDNSIRAPGRIIVLSLDSPGGDISTALQIVDLVRKYSITTYLAPKSECLASCAYIFMAGKRRWRESGPESARIMDVTAKLGFNSPFDQDGGSDFLDGVESIRQIMSVGEDIPIDLFIDSLIYQEKDQYLYVDTFDEAFKYDVHLSGIEYKPFTHRSGEYVCRNFSAFQGLELGRPVDPSIFSKDGRKEYFSAFQINPTDSTNMDWISEFDRIDELQKSDPLNQLIKLPRTEERSEGHVYYGFFYSALDGNIWTDGETNFDSDWIGHLCNATLGYDARSRWLFGMRDVPPGDFAPVVTAEITTMASPWGFNSFDYRPEEPPHHFGLISSHFPYWFAFDLETAISKIAKSEIDMSPTQAILKVSFPYIGMFDDIRR